MRVLIKKTVIYPPPPPHPLDLWGISPWRCSVKNMLLKSSKFTWEHLCQSVFNNKVVNCSPTTCVYVLMYLYSFTCWLLPTARGLWYTWDVRINDLLLRVLLGASAKFPNLSYFTSKDVTPARRKTGEKMIWYTGILWKNDIYWKRMQDGHARNRQATKRYER